MLILQGLRGLTYFDAGGFLFFDASRRGFWRSFLAALWCLPILAISISGQIADLETPAALHLIAMQSIAYVISWLLYPLLVIRVSDMFGVWPNYYRYMVAYNWFRIVIGMLWLPLMLPLGTLSPNMVALLEVLLQATEGIYNWFIARHGLKVETPTAIALALIDFLLGVLISLITAMV